MSLAVGDKVTVTESPWPEALPNGTRGTVIEDVDGVHLFVDFPDVVDPLNGMFGPGWALMASEVTVVEVGA